MIKIDKSKKGKKSNDKITSRQNLDIVPNLRVFDEDDCEYLREVDSWN